MKSRFQRELSGELGAYWQRQAEAELAKVKTDLDSGEIYLTKNFRPLKSLKYVKAEDSLFGAAEVPSMAIYPADGNTRVRWDGAAIRALTDEDFTQMRALAVKSIAAEAKGIKNTLKNAMANPIVYKLTAFEKIGRTPDGTVLRDKNGGSIMLEDFPELEGTVERLGILPA